MYRNHPIYLLCKLMGGGGGGVVCNVDAGMNQQSG